MRPIFALTALALLWSACEKTLPPDPQANNEFAISVFNEYNPLEAQCAAFICDADGQTIHFKWLTPDDSTVLNLPGTLATDRFDCTVIKMTITHALGFADTTLKLTTYSQLRSGTEIHLRENYYQDLVDLNLTFSDLSSLDTLVVSDGLPFTVPEAANNYTGLYRVLQSGKIGLRAKINGENQWRYALVDNVNENAIQLDLQGTTMPTIPDNPTRIQFPFLANWEYNIDAVTNLSKPEMLPLGGFLRAQGGFLANIQFVDIWDFPGVSPGQYRVYAKGERPNEPGTFFEMNRLYNTLPAQLTEPNFEIEKAGPVGNTQATVNSSGVYAVVHFIRNFDRSGLHIEWEFVQQAVTGTIQNELPAVPEALGLQFPDLANYDFGNRVRVRGSFYNQSNAYDLAIAPRLLAIDPLWEAKAGLVSKEVLFEN
ncbi:MAG: hypothetical protein R2792_17375 [Saprospiraceae bacterium]